MHNKLLYRAVPMCAVLILASFRRLQVRLLSYSIEYDAFVVYSQSYHFEISYSTFSYLNRKYFHIVTEIWCTFCRHILIAHEKSMACSPDDKLSISKQEIFYLQPYERTHSIGFGVLPFALLENWICLLSHAERNFTSCAVIVRFGTYESTHKVSPNRCLCVIPSHRCVPKRSLNSMWFSL